MSAYAVPDQLEIETDNGESISFYKTGQVDFELYVDDIDIAKANLSYLEALTMYKWLKEALDQ